MGVPPYTPKLDHLGLETSMFWGSPILGTPHNMNIYIISSYIYKYIYIYIIYIIITNNHRPRDLWVSIF
jgi:hypothetical protein